VSRPKNKFSFASALGWFSGRRSGQTARVFEKSDMGLWAETLNPLRGLTAQRAADIFDRARRGIYAELAWLYQEIEASDPTLFVCTERREAAAGACDWRVTLANPERTAGFEETLAKEQQDFLSAAFGRAGDEIGALAEHLGRAFFRGFAHARPVWEADGVAGFEPLDAWNFARDPSTGQWWWNPDATYCANDNFQEIPEGELVTLERSRHIDYPALAVCIRAALGEKKWGVFLERYGIPPVTVIMPEFADKSEEPAYMAAAEALARAGSGALPFGSQVSYATEARGTNPFSEFLRHQQELTVLLATGGLLTTLTAPGSGTLAGEAHLDTWRAVVARDIRAVARAVNRTVTRRLLAARFPGRPVLARFEFDPDPAPSADEVFETAAKAKSAGYLVVQADLEERTGYKLAQDTMAQGFPPAVTPAAGVTAAPPSAAPAEASVADTAMNGAQVTALLDIIAKVHSGEIDKATAPAIVKSAFPLLSDEQIAAMMPTDSGFQPPLLANKEGAAPADPVAKPLQIDAGACKEPAGVEVTPEADLPSEAILEAFSAEAEKALYASLLDAALDAAGDKEEGKEA